MRQVHKPNALVLDDGQRQDLEGGRQGLSEHGPQLVLRGAQGDVPHKHTGPLLPSSALAHAPRLAGINKPWAPSSGRPGLGGQRCLHRGNGRCGHTGRQRCACAHVCRAGAATSDGGKGLWPGRLLHHRLRGRLAGLGGCCNPLDLWRCWGRCRGRLYVHGGHGHGLRFRFRFGLWLVHFRFGLRLGLRLGFWLGLELWLWLVCLVHSWLGVLVVGSWGVFRLGLRHLCGFFVRLLYVLLGGVWAGHNHVLLMKQSEDVVDHGVVLAACTLGQHKCLHKVAHILAGGEELPRDDNQQLAGGHTVHAHRLDHHLRSGLKVLKYRCTNRRLADHGIQQLVLFTVVAPLGLLAVEHGQQRGVLVEVCVVGLDKGRPHSPVVIVCHVAVWPCVWAVFP
eukprot:comp23701_c0_seq1/m.40720 comp23701_c0_seq1/g.40720  ORF comp23701_c0_seq1/g.40720 comp23701_c0_seq1/m.40720 type:complete len:394 (+) comp23701_c0_seq1:630-1811(+)